jgi:DNA adenine methylase
MRSVIRWAGSKRGQLRVLKKQWNSHHTRYIEPFCGSSCLFFDIAPAVAVLGDLNYDLMEMYRALKSNVEVVINYLEILPATKRDYYRIRSQDTSSFNREQRAARFLYLNRLCFNGIYRTNKKGEFNVPYARPKGRWKFDFDGIREASRALELAELVSGDFETTLSRVEAHDFIFLDPPYAVANRRVFTEYQAESFGPADLNRFASILSRINKAGATFVVSYADCSEARALMSPWNVRRIRARRCIAGFASSRRYSYELLASNVAFHA